MSERELMAMMEMMAGSIGSFIGPIIGTLLSGVILTYCIRWFIFAKAGEKGWKALIPFYSDYINYKIAWDGRIYLALIIGSIGSTILGSILGLIHPALGVVISVITSIVVTGAQAVAKMILQFKFARAFGKNDYFAVGLYFLGNVFTAILAFGDAEYKGAANSSKDVPAFIDNFGKKKPEPAAFKPVQPAVQQSAMHQQHAVPQQQPMQQQGYQAYQQPYNTGSYAPVQQYPQQQPYNTGNYAPMQQYPQQPMQRNSRTMRNQDQYHQ